MNMENFESYQKSIEYLAAQKNWEEKGYLGVTAQDHKAIHSTPDNILIENPSKTLGELMSDTEIIEYIQGTQRNIEENSKYPHMTDFNEDLKKNLETTISYLKTIQRIPEDFTL